MMKEFKVIPHESIGPAQLGMTRDEIRGVLGTPSHVRDAHVKWDIHFPDRDYFYNNAFQVSYDADLKAVFIEVASEPEYVVTYDGISVHESAPKDVVGVIQKHATVDTTQREYPVNLWFPELCLTLYREHSDQDNFVMIGISTRDYREA